MKKIIFTLILIFSFITINAQVNLEDGLIAYYPFNGNADDESGNGHHGLVSGAISTEDKDGNSNSAYKFDGVDDFIQVPDHVDLRLGGTDYTISMWLKVDAFSNYLTHAILSKRLGSDEKGYMFQVIGTNHNQNFPKGSIDLVISGGFDPHIISQDVINKNEWIHCLVCFDLTNQTAQTFLQGELNNQSTMTAPNANTNADLFIGKDNVSDGILITSVPIPNYYGGFYFDGIMDEIRIYNRKLNIDEIRTLKNEIFTSTDLSESPKIKVFPNPVNNTLFIRTENEQVSGISLINISGKIVYQGKFQNEISVIGFTSGIYFLQLKNKNGKIINTKKVVIVNENRA